MEGRQRLSILKQYADIYHDASKLNLNTLTIPLQIAAADASDSNPVITDYSYNEAWEYTESQTRRIQGYFRAIPVHSKRNDRGNRLDAVRY